MHRILEWLTSSQHFFQDLGWLGILLFAGVMMVAQIVMIPLSPFGVAAGMFFGFWGGLLAITLGTGAGAAVNFLISRHIAREPLAHRLEGHEKFQLIDTVIGREGWKIVALLRLVPMPFGLANYCYGLTAIAFWPYLITTIVAITPANSLVAWVGATANEGLESIVSGHKRSSVEYVLMGVGLVAAFCALSYVGRLARAAVAKSGAEAAAEEAAP